MSFQQGLISSQPVHSEPCREYTTCAGSAMLYEGFIQSCFLVDFDGLWADCSKALVGAGGARDWTGIMNIF